MTDLISRRAAIKAIDDLPNCYNGYSDTYDKAYIIGVLEELPTIEPKVEFDTESWKTTATDTPIVEYAPVVRCRDCKHRQAKMGDCYGNAVVLCKDGLWRDMEFFCADGERSEE